MSSELILGHGYVGQFLSNQLIDAIGTHRSKPLRFQLEDRSTWNDLPRSEKTFWLFAPEDPALTHEFISAHASHLGRIVVLGTTSHYLEQDLIDEKSPPANSLRTQCEEILKKYNAVIVRSSGIVGPNRSPLSWLTKGRIRDLNKTVNLVDVEDLTQFLIRAMEHGASAFDYIAHGFTAPWGNILQTYLGENGLKPTDRSLLEQLQEQRPAVDNLRGKQIDNTWSKTSLSVKPKVNSISDYIRLRGLSHS